MRDLLAPGFVGRARELELLTRSLAGESALVLVTGEAGIGKSRLIREFVASPDGQRKKTLIAVCPPFRDPCTLGPVADALRLAADDLSRLRLSGLAGALRPLFPEWSAELPPPPEALADATAEKFRLFRALAELIDGLKVAVLILEDAHHADDGTLEFLAFLAARVPPRLSLLVTFREEEQPPVMLLRLSSRQASGTPVARIPLAGFPVEQTGALVSSMLAGTQVSPEFASFLHHHTDGIPLAIEESVRLLYDRRDLIWNGGSWGRRYLADLDVPPTFRDAVLERVARLGDDALAVLHAAAVLALPAGEPSLAELTGLPRTRLRAGLVAVLGAGLLCEDRPGMLRLRHSLTGRAVYDAIPPPRRGELHARVARLLGRLASPPKAQLARHYRSAGDVANWRKFAEDAADIALTVGDEASACSLLYEVITDGGLPADDLVRLAQKIPFSAFGGQARLGEVADLLRAALSGQASSRLEAVLRLALGRVLYFMEEFTPAMEELARAIPGLAGDPVATARWMGMLSWPEGTDWPVSVHRRWLRRADRALARVQAAGPGTESQLWLGPRVDRVSALLQLGDDQGWTEAEGIPDEGGNSAENARIATFHANLSEDATMWGRYAESQRRIGLGLRLAVRYEYLRIRNQIDVQRLRLDWYTGAWDGLAQRAAALAGDPDIASMSRLEATLVSGRLLAVAGDTRAAGEQLGLVHSRSRRHAATNQAAESAAALAALRLGARDVEAALELTREPAEMIARKGTWLWATSLFPVRVEALAASGQLAEAAALTQAFARGARGRNAAASAAALATCRAILADARSAAGGRAGPAAVRVVAMHAHAASAWEALPRPYDALLARQRQALCLLAIGHREQGSDMLARVLTGLEDLGAAGDAARVNRLLREHGVATPQVWRGGQRGYGDRLSPRELEVVRLVQDGLTNRQIAERLCRSPKTVATQLNSAMRKLGVSSRTALAVRALEAGMTDSG